MKNLIPISRKITRAFALWLGISCLASPAFALEGLQIGMTAPLVKLKDLQGKEVALADQRDANAVVVVFWATWSDNSAPMLERLERLYRKHKREKLRILAVNVEKQQPDAEDLAQIKKIVSRLGLSFSVLMDEGLKTFREYGVVAVPSTAVLDREGVIRGEMASFPLAQREELFDLIEALAEKREIARKEEKKGYQPVPRAVRYYNLARAMVSRGMSDAVDENLKKSISADPNFVLPLLLLAKLYRERAETEESIEFRGTAVVTATFKAEKEKYLKQAAELVGKALVLAPQSASVLMEDALVLIAVGKRDVARQKLLEAIKTETSYTPAHFLLASLRVREGRLKEGETEFQKALQLNPLDHQAYLAMAAAYEEKGMEKNAVEFYKKVHEMLYKERELFPLSYGR
ncbi:MAG: redoxin domain-containing protein [Deltaproteobacteria bacterium]|nr:redoxin domain-containing protein [Deltaproteobacteria bacterium]